jgi:hypothetical protein
MSIIYTLQHPHHAKPKDYEWVVEGGVYKGSDRVRKVTQGSQLHVK